MTRTFPSRLKFSPEGREVLIVEREALLE